MGFKGFRPRINMQNFTSVPNEFFDEELTNIDTVAELKVVLAVFRKTYGWIDKVENGVPIYKVEDSISYSQFTELTGLSSASIADGVKRAIEHGYIEKVKTGNFTSGESSRYRLSQWSKTKQMYDEEFKREYECDWVNEKQQQIKAEEVTNNEETFKVTPEVSEKDLALAELLGGTKEEDTPKNTEKKKHYQQKPIQNWNCNDLLAYFADRYRTFVGIPFGLISGKDRKNAKALIDDGSIPILDIVKAIDFYLKNYKNIAELPKGYPSFAVFFGWRNTLIPMALVGDKAANKGTKNKNVREYEESNNDNWVPTDWGDSN